MAFTNEQTIQALWRGFRLHCPNCGKGIMFQGLFNMAETCSHCHVRYERKSGESIGGMFINLSVAELFSVGGWILTELFLRPPLVPELIFWGAFNLIFVLIFYRHSRGLWVAISYLTNGVYADPGQ